MKHCVFIICLFLGTLPGLLFAQNDEKKGIEFFHGSFSEALKMAEKENKLIFMDAFTTWCGPCKRMSNSVFPDATVGEFYNANFINLKIDMEKGEGPSLGSKYSVRSYPTLLYIDANGKVVHVGSGARPSDAFIELGREALQKIDKSMEFEKKYAEGDRDPKTVLSYIRSMNLVGKPSLRITNDYLSSQKDLSTPENLEIILEGATDADSRIFDYLIQNKSSIIKLKSQDVFEKKVYNACNKTFKKSVEYRNESLLMESQNKMKNLPSKAAEFKANTDMEYYGQTGNTEKFSSAVNVFVSKIAKKDAVKLRQASTACMKYFPENKSIMAIAEKTGKLVMQYGAQQESYMHYAVILRQVGKKSDAIQILKKAIELAKSKSEPTNILDNALRELEGS